MTIESIAESPSFQERFALILGGSALFAFGVMHRRPSAAGVVVASLGGVFLGLGTDWLRHFTLPGEKSTNASRVTDDKKTVQ